MMMRIIISALFLLLVSACEPGFPAVLMNQGPDENAPPVYRQGWADGCQSGVSVYGNDIYNANKGVRFGNENYTDDFYQNRWHGAGTSNTYPSADLSGANLDPNSWFVEKGSFIRIRTVQVGYTLSSHLLERWKIQKLRLYLNAQNPYTYFAYKGFTPEIGGAPMSTGIDLNVYPLSATYNFGVNMIF